MADEGPAADGAHEFSEVRHKRYWLSLVLLLRDSQEFLEILGVHFFLAREVCLESLTREEAIKTLSVVDMGFSV